MIVSFFLRMTLAILFLTTAWSKWRGWDRHTQLMTAYRIIPSGMGSMVSGRVFDQ